MEAFASNAYGTIRLRSDRAYSEESQRWLQETVDLIAKKSEAMVRDAIVHGHVLLIQEGSTDIYGVTPKQE